MRIVCAVLILSLPYCDLARSADEKSCDDHKSSESGKHELAPYHFKYHSWVEKNEKGKDFEFGCCVENLSKHDVYIDWTGTPITRKFVPPTDRLSSMFNWPTNSAITQDRVLWFGSVPEPLQTRFLASVKTDVRENDDKEERPIALEPVPYESTMPLRSTTRTTIGRGDRQMAVNVYFESDVLLLSDQRFLYRLAWSAKLPQKMTFQPKLLFSIPEWSRNTIAGGSVSKQDKEFDPVRKHQITIERNGFAFTSAGSPNAVLADINVQDFGADDQFTVRVPFFMPRK